MKRLCIAHKFLDILCVVSVKTFGGTWFLYHLWRNGRPAKVWTSWTSCCRVLLRRPPAATVERASRKLFWQ